MNKESLKQKLKNYWIIIKHNFDWEEISKYQYLTEDFIEKYQDKVNWKSISYYQYYLSEEFLEKHIEKIDFGGIIGDDGRFFYFNFIEKHLDRLTKANWKNLVRYQILSESFMEKYQDKLDWMLIARYQFFGYSFFEKYRHKLPLQICKSNYKVKNIVEYL